MTIRKQEKLLRLPKDPYMGEVTNNTITSEKHDEKNIGIIKKVNKKYKKISKKCKKYSKKIIVYKKYILYILMLLSVLLLIGIYISSVMNNKPIIKEISTDISIVKKIIIAQPKKIKNTKEEFFVIPISNIEDSIRKFVMQWFGKDDPIYVDKVVKAYMKLLNKEEKNKQNVFYYIALCSRESNFRMSTRSSVHGSIAKGAVGISQVRPTIWAKTVKENYGISREELCTDIYSNIYAGYRIWDNYRRKGDGSILSANTGYLGGSAKKYTSDINKRYVSLMTDILNSMNKE